MKMEQIECSETSAYIIQTPGNHPKENIIYIALLVNCLETRMSPQLPFIFLVPYNSGCFNVIPVTLSLIQGMIKPRERAQDSYCLNYEDSF